MKPGPLLTVSESFEVFKKKKGKTDGVPEILEDGREPSRSQIQTKKGKIDGITPETLEDGRERSRFQIQTKKGKIDGITPETLEGGCERSRSQIQLEKEPSVSRDNIPPLDLLPRESTCSEDSTPSIDLRVLNKAASVSKMKNYRNYGCGRQHAKGPSIQKLSKGARLVNFCGLNAAAVEIERNRIVAGPASPASASANSPSITADTDENSEETPRDRSLKTQEEDIDNNTRNGEQGAPSYLN